MAAVLPVLDRTLQRFGRALGNQEDAHEFLNFLLENLHTELHSVCAGSEAKQEPDDTTNEDDGWCEVGSKNRKVVMASSVVETESPISALFGGRMRLVLCKKGRGLQDSVSLQRFYSLHLNISEPHIRSVEDALEAYMSKEVLEGYRAGSREVAASQQVTLDRLPALLSLHIKRFSAQMRKLQGHISFPQLLTLPSKFVFGQKLGVSGSRHYRLRSVVVHHGHSLTNGHYTAYVNAGQGNDENWHLFDDNNVRQVSPQTVADQSAYLLMYEQYSL